MTVDSGATLSGSGTILNNLTNSGGTIIVGGADSIGNITVDGNFSQASGTLDMELAGANSYDTLTVLGTAKLGGTLNVTLILGDKPLHG